MVSEYKGAYSGEHGDGLVRSEWIEPIFGARLDARVRRDQGALRPEGADEPRQDRAADEDGRSVAVPLQARLRAAQARHRARLVGVDRAGRAVAGLRRGGRDVQQQRPLPQVRRRHDVPVVPRDRRRAASHARPRQHAAPRALRPARPRGVHVGRRCYETMSLCVSCKGCKRECPTGVDMAQDEDRVPAPLSRTPRPFAEGPARRVSCRATHPSRRAWRGC